MITFEKTPVRIIYQNNEYLPVDAIEEKNLAYFINDSSQFFPYRQYIDKLYFNMTQEEVNDDWVYNTYGFIPTNNFIFSSVNRNEIPSGVNNLWYFDEEVNCGKVFVDTVSKSAAFIANKTDVVYRTSPYGMCPYVRYVRGFHQFTAYRDAPGNTPYYIGVPIISTFTDTMNYAFNNSAGLIGKAMCPPNIVYMESAYRNTGIYEVAGSYNVLYYNNAYRGCQRISSANIPVSPLCVSLNNCFRESSVTDAYLYTCGTMDNTYAHSSVENIQAVNFPASVMTNCFKGCHKINRVNFNSNITEANYMFSDTNINTVNMSSFGIATVNGENIDYTPINSVSMFENSNINTIGGTVHLLSSDSMFKRANINNIMMGTWRFETYNNLFREASLKNLTIAFYPNSNNGISANSMFLNSSVQNLSVIMTAAENIDASYMLYRANGLNTLEFSFDPSCNFNFTNMAGGSSINNIRFIDSTMNNNFTYSAETVFNNMFSSDKPMDIFVFNSQFGNAIKDHGFYTHYNNMEVTYVDEEHWGVTKQWEKTSLEYLILGGSYYINIYL